MVSTSSKVSFLSPPIALGGGGGGRRSPAPPAGVSFIDQRPLRGIRTQAALMAVGNCQASSSCSAKALFLEPLFQCLSPVEKREVEREEREEEEKREPVTEERLDEWIKESVSEIVRNIGEAPFLVQIFSGGREKALRVERESAEPDTWPLIKKRWAHHKSYTPPDGIILVDRIKEEKEEEEEEEQERGNNGGIPSSSSRNWGLVVQGRGMDCVACYILNTCRVRSPAGFCTHFCLARAKCFGDPLELQLRNAWLHLKR